MDGTTEDQAFGNLSVHAWVGSSWGYSSRSVCRLLVLSLLSVYLVSFVCLYCLFSLLSVYLVSFVFLFVSFVCYLSVILSLLSVYLVSFVSYLVSFVCYLISFVCLSCTADLECRCIIGVERGMNLWFRNLFWSYSQKKKKKNCPVWVHLRVTHL